MPTTTPLDYHVPEISDREPPNTPFDTVVLTLLSVLGLIFTLPFAAATLLGIVAIFRAPNSVMVLGTITAAAMAVALSMTSLRMLRTVREQKQATARSSQNLSLPPSQTPARKGFFSLHTRHAHSPAPRSSGGS